MKDKAGRGHFRCPFSLAGDSVFRKSFILPSARVRRRRKPQEGPNSCTRAEYCALSLRKLLPSTRAPLISLPGPVKRPTRITSIGLPAHDIGPLCSRISSRTAARQRLLHKLSSASSRFMCRTKYFTRIKLFVSTFRAEKLSLFR